MSKSTTERLDEMDPEDVEIIEKTYADTHRSSLSKAEAKAVELLHDDGWSVGELEMTFQVNETAIRRAAKTGEP